MDPNAAHVRICQLIAEIRQQVDHGSEDAGERWFAVEHELSELVDTWNGLDEWLGRGGFLPRAWVVR